MTAVLFIVLAGVGATVRHLVNELRLDWLGTLAINVVGAFALGFLVAGDPSEATTTVIGVGLLGSLTTFSTFALEATEGPARRRVAVVTTGVVLGVAAAALGFSIR